MTESFIRNNHNITNFIVLEYGNRTHPIFSIGFYREFADTLNWWKISKNNILSLTFLKEFANHIKWDEYFQNKNILSFDELKLFFDLIPTKYMNYFISNRVFSEDQLNVALLYCEVDYFVDAFLVSDVSESFLNNYIIKIPKKSNKRDSYLYREQVNKFIKKYNIQTIL